MSNLLNRRGILHGLATLPLIGGGASLIGLPTPAAATEPSKSDEGLIDLVRRWEELESEHDQLVSIQDERYEAFAAIRDQPIAELIRAAEDDRFFGTGFGAQRSNIWACIDIERIQEPDYDYVRPSEYWSARTARHEELKRGVETYRNQRKAAMVQSGLQEVNDQIDALWELISPVQAAIISTPAHTLAGVAAKAKLAAQYMTDAMAEQITLPNGEYTYFPDYVIGKLSSPVTACSSRRQ
jgi:hypothetical protein